MAGGQDLKQSQTSKRGRIRDKIMTKKTTYTKSQRSKYGLRDYKVGESRIYRLDTELWRDEERSAEHHYASIRSNVSQFGARHMKKFETELVKNKRTGELACRIRRVK